MKSRSGGSRIEEDIWVLEGWNKREIEEFA
jgi:hypothetical protein